MSRSRKPQQRKTPATAAQARQAAQRSKIAGASASHPVEPMADAENTVDEVYETEPADVEGDDVVPYEATEDDELKLAEDVGEEILDDPDGASDLAADDVADLSDEDRRENTGAPLVTENRRRATKKAATTRAGGKSAAGKPGATAAARKPAKKAAVKEATKADRRAALRARQEAEAKKRRTRRIVGAIAGILGFLLLAGGLVWLINFLENKDARVRPPHAVGLKGIRVADGTPLKDKAPTVVLYHDYQCPGCKGLEADYAPILNEMAKNGEIRYELHTLTFLDGSLGTEHSKRAASAAACADEVGKYSEAVAKIYEMQPAKEGQGWTEDQLTKDVPQATGMDAGQKDQYLKCYQSNKYLDFVKAVDKRGAAELVNAGEKVATPKILVNGKPLQAERVKAGDPKTIRDAIEASK